MSEDTWLSSALAIGSKLHEECARYARSLCPLLVCGEPGVGKSLLAAKIHRLSGRSGDFLRTSIGEVTESLAQAELLGHVKGAFTGADRDRKGLVESARNGMLLLDEIGDASLAVQLLCLPLTERPAIVRPVGATRSVAVDVRIIGATNKDLRTAVREGRFRRDLLDRFGWSVIQVPPLRDRRDEIPSLVDRFLATEADEQGIGPVRLSPQLREHFRKARWEGNIRHLRYVCHRIVLFHSDSQPVTLDQLPEGICDVSTPFDVPNALPLTYEVALAAVEAHGGNRTRAAETLGWSLRHLHRILRKGLADEDRLKVHQV